MNNTILDDYIIADQEYQYASLGARFGAAILDSFLLFFIIIFLTYINLTRLYSPIIELITTLIFPVYKVLMEGIFGYTLGKKALGFKIMKLNAPTTKMDISTALIRYIFGWPGLLISAISIYYTFDVNLMMQVFDWESYTAYTEKIDKKIPPMLSLAQIVASLAYFIAICFIFEGMTRQTLYDRIAKTICVKNEIA